MNSPMMRMTRHVSVLLKSRMVPGAVLSGACSSFSSSVTGLTKSRMSSSILRAAPELRFLFSCDGGVRPAARCPSSVRSFRPSCASAWATASWAGLPLFPVAVRGERPLAAFAVPLRIAMRES